MLIVAACVSWGIDNNLTRKLSSADPVQIAMLKGLVAGTVNLVLALTQGAALPGTTTILAAGVVGFLGDGVSLALFVLGLRHLGTARTGAYFSLAPFIGALLSLTLLDEPLMVRLVMAGGLMALGLRLHLTGRHEHEHIHEVTEHEHRHTHDGHHQHLHGPEAPLGEPHSHWHRHRPLRHRHPHFPICITGTATSISSDTAKSPDLSAGPGKCLDDTTIGNRPMKALHDKGILRG
jgi:hypothetical protein